MKKRIVQMLAILLVCVMALGACANTANTPSNPSNAGTPSGNPGNTNTDPSNPGNAGTMSDETLRVVMKEEPVTMFNTYSMSNQPMIGYCLYDTLLRIDDDGNIWPNLVTEWEWIDDTHLKMKLRDDVVAYDGSILTAHDVLYSIELLKNGNMPGLSISIDLDECSVIDDFTFIIGTPGIYPMVLNALSSSCIITIVDQSSYEALNMDVAEVATCPKIGTGPYFFDEWVSGQYVRLVRNDNYWGEPGYYKYIEFTWVSDAASRSMALQAGDVDIAGYLTTNERSLSSNPDVQVVERAAGTAMCLWMNCSQKPLDDERVRKAIWYLIDDAAIIEIMTAGQGTPCETNFASANPYYDKPGSDYVREVNVDAAKQLLAEAGYPDGLTVEITGMSEQQTMIEAMQAMLAQGGINLKITIVERANMQALYYSGEYMMYIKEARSYDHTRLLNSVDGRVDLNTASGGAQINDPELNELIDAARYSINDDERFEAYRAVQAYLRDHTVVIGLYDDITIAGAAAGLTGWEFNYDGDLIVSHVRPE